MTIHALRRIQERAPKDNASLVLSAITAAGDAMPLVSELLVTGQTCHFFRTNAGVGLFPVMVYGAVKTVLSEGMTIQTPTGPMVLVAPDGHEDAITFKMPADLPDGIYFRLDEKVYHALPRLSMSGIQKIMQSPADFWQASWLNPRNQTEDEEEATNAQILGRAYHIARFEPDRFDALYARDMAKADMPKGTLFTGDEVAAELEKRGLPKSKAGEKVLDKAMRLIDAGFTGKIWHFEYEMFSSEVGERTLLAAHVYDQILIDIAALQSNPEVGHYLRGGQPEVSILWTCPRTGIRMKARLDYLRPDGFTDFKTFENPQGKELVAALTGAFQYNRYYIQAVGYWQVVEMVRGGLIDIAGEPTPEEVALIDAIRARRARMGVHYVWQQKKGVPNILVSPIWLHARPQGSEPNASGLSPEQYDAVVAAMDGASAVHHKGAMEIERAKRIFKLYSEVYEPGAEWYPLKPIFDIDDGSFSPYWLESAWGE